AAAAARDNNCMALEELRREDRLIRHGFLRTDHLIRASSCSGRRLNAPQGSVLTADDRCRADGGCQPRGCWTNIVHYIMIWYLSFAREHLRSAFAWPAWVTLVLDRALVDLEQRNDCVAINVSP